MIAPTDSKLLPSLRSVRKVLNNGTATRASRLRCRFPGIGT
ncbi:hypothetical protein P4C99_21055 [Pontiellaceae bacterium B1224]|nr:hypothetical protein [Pontiellaceae bacterium B1224]